MFLFLSLHSFYLSSWVSSEMKDDVLQDSGRFDEMLNE